MIDPAKFLQQFQSQGIDFFTGVPDSLMKELLVCIDQSPVQHYIAANEGLAIGLACGYHLGTGKIPLIYLQNSGLGNIINPITSLADEAIYSIPMVLLIGWRGEPGLKDEPQHVKMGKITKPMLDVLGIPYYEVTADENDTNVSIQTAIDTARDQQKPAALLVHTNIFEALKDKSSPNPHPLSREAVIDALYKKIHDDDIVVCTTGKAGREFDAVNRLNNYRIKKYFLSVGSMGHANHIALGLSMFQKQGRTIMLDGDGALLMHLGSMPAVAQWADTNFIHIVLNNESHESVGGQATLAASMDLTALATACSYELVKKIETADELESFLQNFDQLTGPAFIEIRINKASRPDLSRPTISPIEAKQQLMQQLGSK